MTTLDMDQAFVSVQSHLSNALLTVAGAYGAMVTGRKDLMAADMARGIEELRAALKVAERIQRTIIEPLASREAAHRCGERRRIAPCVACGGPTEAPEFRCAACDENDRRRLESARREGWSLDSTPRRRTAGGTAG